MIAKPSVRTRLAIAASLLPLLPASAFAAAATASQDVNVRSGPAITFGVVAQIQRGDTVDVTKCQGSFCYITVAGGPAGWVSATYLTRDSVPKAPTLIPAAPQIATIRPAQPQVAAAPPRALGTLPPAYDAAPVESDAGGSRAYGDIAAVPPRDGNDPGYPVIGRPANPAASDPYYADTGNGQDVVLPPDSGNVIASTDGMDVPRPKADIPDGAISGPGDEIAADGPDMAPDANGAPADSNSDWNLGPPVGWRGHPGLRGGLAGIPASGRAEACFFSTGGADPRFCLGAGQSVSEFGNSNDRVYAIRNPRGLRVTICSTGGGACRIYDTSGPVRLPQGAAMASITVEPPPGY